MGYRNVRALPGVRHLKDRPPAQEGLKSERKSGAHKDSRKSWQEGLGDKKSASRRRLHRFKLNHHPKNCDARHILDVYGKW
jgi:hypothetical protein